MYLPDDFRQQDHTKIHSFIRQYPFGILVSDFQTLLASHLPFLLDELKNPKGVLISHMAKSNHQWEGLAEQDVMVIFNGPHAYISPTWYETPEAVPTWNYTAVHVYGKFIPIVDEQEWTAVLAKMVGFFEKGSEKWTLESLPSDFYEKLKHMTAAFKIEINRMEGKWKLSQNHSRERRERVIQHLDKGGWGEKEIAILMREGMGHDSK